MARKTKILQITDEGRDKGKTYVLTEMPASKATKWGIRALQAMAKAGINVDTDMGMAGVAVAGIQALVHAPFSDVEPLMDEMLACVVIAPDPQHPEFTRQLIEDDIEEIATHLQLRAEVFTLHTGFSFPAARPL